MRGGHKDAGASGVAGCHDAQFSFVAVPGGGVHMVLGLCIDGSYLLSVTRGESAATMVEESHAGQCELGSLSLQDLATALLEEIPPAQMRYMAARQTAGGGWDCTQLLLTGPPGQLLLVQLRYSPSQSQRAAAVTIVTIDTPSGQPLHSGLQHFLHHAQVLPGTGSTKDEPFVAFAGALVPVARQASDGASAGGAVRLSLYSLSRSARRDGRLGLSAVLFEATLIPVFGEVVSICAALSVPRAACGAAEAAPHVFVAATGGLYCVLADEVLSVPLQGVMGLAPLPPVSTSTGAGGQAGSNTIARGSGPAGRGASGSRASGRRPGHSGDTGSCLVLTESGAAVVSLEVAPAADEKAGPKSAGASAYRLAVARLSGDALPRELASAPPLLRGFPSVISVPVAAHGSSAPSSMWLAAARSEDANGPGSSGSSFRLELKGLTQQTWKLSIARAFSSAAPAKVKGSSQGESGARFARACCAARWPQQELDCLCVAMEAPSQRGEYSQLELWQPGVPRQRIPGLGRPAALSVHLLGQLGAAAWPEDVELLAVGAVAGGGGGGGAVVAATSRSQARTATFLVPSSGSGGAAASPRELPDLGYFASKFSLHMSLHPTGKAGSDGQLLVQVTEREVAVFCSGTASLPGSAAPLCQQALQPLCCHAACCSAATTGGARELWVFAGVASVITRYAATCSLAATALQTGARRACSGQVAALCVVPGGCTGSGSRQQPPCVAVALWLQPVVLLLDGGSLDELARCVLTPEPSRATSLLALPQQAGSGGAQDLLLGSADGHLLQLRCSSTGEVPRGQPPRPAKLDLTVVAAWQMGRQRLKVSALPKVLAAEQEGLLQSPAALILCGNGRAFCWQGERAPVPCDVTGAALLGAVALHEGLSDSPRPPVIACMGRGSSSEGVLLHAATLEEEASGVAKVVRTEAKGLIASIAYSRELGALLVLLRAPPSMASEVGGSLGMKLLLLDEHLQSVGQVTLGGAGSADGMVQAADGAAAWAAEVRPVLGGALVALAAPGGGPPHSLVRISLRRVEEDGSWLDAAPGRSGSSSSRGSDGARIEGSVTARVRLEDVALLATHGRLAAPLLLSGCRIQSLEPESLGAQHAVPLAELGLQDRGVVTALCLCVGHPKAWSTAAAAAAGAPLLFAFLAFATGAPAILQLPGAGLLPPEMAAPGSKGAAAEVLRLAPSAAEPPRPPLLSAAAFEGAHGPVPCGFVAVDGAGRCFAWLLSFQGGPQARPNVELVCLPIQVPWPVGGGLCGGAATPWALWRFAATTPPHGEGEADDGKGSPPLAAGLGLCFVPAGKRASDRSGSEHAAPEPYVADLASLLAKGI